MFSNEHVSLSISEDNTKSMLKISGSLTKPRLYSKRVVFAANPIDRMSNYTGSGLAFPNNDIAFENTPNYFEVPESGTIETVFYKPNSYYSPDTFTRVLPSIFIKIVPIDVKEEPIIIRFKLEDPLPLKSRKDRSDGPNYYAKKSEIIGVRSQYEIMKMIKDVKTKYNVA